MCEGIFGGVIDLDYLLGEKSSDETITLDLSGYTEEEKREIGNLWGEGNCGMLQQDATYMGIPFEAESKLKPFCPVRWAREE